VERDTGPCTDYKPYWYFEPVTRVCRRFLYGGCEGNGNRFNSSEECQSSCVLRNVVVTKAMPTAAAATTTTTTEAEVVVEPTDDIDDDHIGDDSVKETGGE
jgi:hypothetical protein